MTGGEVGPATRSRIALCGWCRSELPDSGDWTKDAPEVQHHFFVAHNVAVGHSITYVYTDEIEAEFYRWADRNGARNV